MAGALMKGASVRMVAGLGVSATTVQTYGRAHGRPSEENRARFYESRFDREERESRTPRSGPGWAPHRPLFWTGEA